MIKVRVRVGVKARIAIFLRKYHQPLPKNKSLTKTHTVSTGIFKLGFLVQMVAYCSCCFWLQHCLQYSETLDQ